MSGLPGLLRRRPEVALAAITFVWGSTFIVTKNVLRDVPVLLYVSLRFGIAALVLLALYPRTLRSGRALLRDGALLGALQASGLLLQVVGQLYTTASKSSFVTALSTALTPLVCLVFLREVPRRTQLLGALIATIGLGLLTWPVGDAEWNRGDLCALACAFVYAWVIVETSRRSRLHEVGPLATAQTAFAALYFITLLVVAHAAIAVVPAGRLPPMLAPILAPLLAIEARPIDLHASSVLRVLYMAIVCTVCTFIAQTWAMRRMTATHAAVVFSLEPLFATGLAIAVDGGAEWPGSRGVVGGGLILAGVLASELRGRPGEAAAEAESRSLGP